MLMKRRSCSAACNFARELFRPDHGNVSISILEPVLPWHARFDGEERQRLKMWTAEDRERYKEDGRRYPSDLTDAEWGLVRSLFEHYATLTRDLRVMVEGCL